MAVDGVVVLVVSAITIAIFIMIGVAAVGAITRAATDASSIADGTITIITTANRIRATTVTATGASAETMTTKQRIIEGERARRFCVMDERVESNAARTVGGFSERCEIFYSGKDEIKRLGRPRFSLSDNINR